LHPDHLDFLQEHYVKFTKRTIAGAVAGTMLAGGVAYAAMTLTGAGTAHADAYQGANLTITAEHVSKPIYPGVTADLSFTVTNDNPFPVTIKQISFDASRAGQLSVACATGEERYLTAPTATGTVIDLPAAQQSIIPAKAGSTAGSGTVTAVGAVHLDAAATAGCSFTVPFKVTGAGSGN
jgi:hypothetical protein